MAAGRFPPARATRPPRREHARVRPPAEAKTLSSSQPVRRRKGEGGTRGLERKLARSLGHGAQARTRSGNRAARQELNQGTGVACRKARTAYSLSSWRESQALAWGKKRKRGLVLP